MHHLCRGTCLLFCIGNNLLIGGDVFFARARALLRERRREEKKRVRESVRGAFACGDSRDDVRPKRRCVE